MKFLGRILEINLSDHTWHYDAYDTELIEKILSGGGFNVWYLFHHLTPGIDPLGPSNILVFSMRGNDGYYRTGVIQAARQCAFPPDRPTGQFQCPRQFWCKTAFLQHPEPDYPWTIKKALLPPKSITWSPLRS